MCHSIGTTLTSGCKISFAGRMNKVAFITVVNYSCKNVSGSKNCRASRATCSRSTPSWGASSAQTCYTMRLAPALLLDISLAWRNFPVTNTLAYLAAKSFYNIDTWAQCYETFSGLICKNVCNKLECFFLSGLVNLVYCLWVRPGAYPREKHLRSTCASLGRSPVLLAKTILGLPGTNTLAYHKHS